MWLSMHIYFNEGSFDHQALVIYHIHPALANTPDNFLFYRKDGKIQSSSKGGNTSDDFTTKVVYIIQHVLMGIGLSYVYCMLLVSVW